MKMFKLASEYRWPIFVGGLLSMSVIACASLVWVATRPDSPRPIAGYYAAARAWDATEAELEASRLLGWGVRYELPADVPYFRGMPRPVDVTVVDRGGSPVTGLTGRLVATRPADERLSQEGAIVAIPNQAGHYRTLMRIDDPGAWELRLDVNRESMRFVHAARLQIAATDTGAGGGAR